MNSSSLISPRSSRKRGRSSPSASPTRKARPRFSGEMPLSSWKAAKAASSGVVRTPPKSETIVVISLIAAAGDLVGAEALAPLDRPAEEGDLRVDALATDADRVDQRSGAAQRPHLLEVRPELQGRPALDAVSAVLGREQRLLEGERGPLGVAEGGRHHLVAVGGAAVGHLRGQGQQPAVGEDDPDRPPHDLTSLAHGPQPSDTRAGLDCRPMAQLRIRDADPTRDAAACAAIYAPHVEGSAVSFEERAPGEAELAARIERYAATHAWLVAEREG